EGQAEAVWKAIYFHYLPVGVEADAPPGKAQLGQAPVTWAAVALADKLDTLVGLFAAGEKPTGSRDPYGLRRAAQGVVKLLVDLQATTGLGVRPTLGPMFEKAWETLAVSAPADVERESFFTFFMERLRHLMQARGLHYEEIQAATGQVSRIRDISPADLVDRAREIGAMRSSAVFASVADAFKRPKNLLAPSPDPPPS